MKWCKNKNVIKSFNRFYRSKEKMEEKQIEIQQSGEREFLIGGDRISYGDDDIVYAVSVGDCNGEKATACVEAMHTIITIKGKIKILVDFNTCGKHTPEARKIWDTLNDLEAVLKIALFGLHPVARVAASFVIGVTGKKNMRFFKTPEEALAWLKE